jgi:hypothetical protein
MSPGSAHRSALPAGANAAVVAVADLRLVAVLHRDKPSIGRIRAASADSDERVVVLPLFCPPATMFQRRRMASSSARGSSPRE